MKRSDFKDLNLHVGSIIVNHDRFIVMRHEFHGEPQPISLQRRIQLALEQMDLSSHRRGQHYRLSLTNFPLFVLTEPIKVPFHAEDVYHKYAFYAISSTGHTMVASVWQWVKW